MMRKLIGFFILLTAFTASVRPAVGNDLPRDVLGVRPGMSEEEARRRLYKVGREQIEERMKHGVWEVRDSRIAHVGVRFDNKTRVVRWVTAIARKDAKNRLRYSDIGDLKRARELWSEITKDPQAPQAAAQRASAMLNFYGPAEAK